MCAVSARPWWASLPGGVELHHLGEANVIAGGIPERRVDPVRLGGRRVVEVTPRAPTPRRRPGSRRSPGRASRRPLWPPGRPAEPCFACPASVARGTGISTRPTSPCPDRSDAKPAEVPVRHGHIGCGPPSRGSWCRRPALRPGRAPRTGRCDLEHRVSSVRHEPTLGPRRARRLLEKCGSAAGRTAGHAARDTHLGLRRRMASPVAERGTAIHPAKAGRERSDAGGADGEADLDDRPVAGE